MVAALRPITLAVVFGMYFLNAESYVVDDDIEMISTSDVELESSSTNWLGAALTTGLGWRARRLLSGSMILAIENFSGPFCWGMEDCVIVAGGGGETETECMFDEIIVLFADSIIGLFDVNGTPIGLHGCMPLEICQIEKREKQENH